MIEGMMMQLGEKRQANVTFTNGRKELSLCVDNGPLARTEKLYRSDIRLFHNGDDVTSRVFGCGRNEVVRGNVENMDQAMRWLRRSLRGLEAQTGNVL